MGQVVVGSHNGRGYRHAESTGRARACSGQLVAEPGKRTRPADAAHRANQCERACLPLLSTDRAFGGAGSPRLRSGMWQSIPPTSTWRTMGGERDDFTLEGAADRMIGHERDEGHRVIQCLTHRHVPPGYPAPRVGCPVGRL